MLTRLSFFCLLLSITSLVSGQTPWEVPSDWNVRLCSTPFSDESRKTGGELYQTNCKSCHGDPGKNNVIQLVPLPPDPASVQMQLNSDGALHYKISEGRVTMPSFKNIVNSADIWNIIAYLRSFNKEYQQQTAPKPQFAGESFGKVNLELLWDAPNKKVVTLLTGVKGSVSKPIPAMEMKLFAKRYFGNLMIGKPMETNSEGKAYFPFPENLPGDGAGMVALVAQLSNEEIFGLVKAESQMAIGMVSNRPPLNESRALWNVGLKTPVWLLLSYLTVVLGVWGSIILVMLRLRTIFKMGK